MRKVFYVGWIGFGNIGDDLMWDVFRESADLLMPEQTITVVPSMPGVSLQDVADYDVVVLGGGSLLIPGYVDVLHHALKQGKQVAVWGSGVDWITKKDMLSLLSGDTGKIQYQATPEHRKMLKNISQNAIFSGVRGPLTKKLLEYLDVDADRFIVSGDPGVLLRSDDLEPPINTKMWPSNEKVVGINWGTSYNRIYGGQEEHVENQLAEACKMWIQAGYKLYLYYVWNPDREALTRLADKIGSTEAVRIAPKVYSAQALMRIMKRCAFTVNFKLHANVMSAAAEVPFIALGYRMKTFDFVESIGLHSSVVSTDEERLAEKLEQTSSHILENWKLDRHRLQANIAAYQTSLRSPFLQAWS
ncbi:polysaccharide pyruvyl transferase family protein [Paenibacillus sp. P36]|uniref:polysaccharide pyruvyl transferase family protein n=1 Tax=Paenibacillus sp. P36 TaxID=3342538 RepID=UPI0038B3EE7F